MKINKEIFELGRGAKLIPMEYWHQYVLKYDFQNKLKPFIVSEIGKDTELFNLNLDLNELQSERWKELLEITDCSTIVKSYVSTPEETERKWRKKSAEQTLFLGKWLTSEIIEVLNYNSNHGNWVSSIDIPGRFKFEVDEESENSKNCRVLIPVEYSSVGLGYYSIYQGRFELTLNHLLIWQNDISPARIKYKWIDEEIELELFDHKIKFVRDL